MKEQIQLLIAQHKLHKEECEVEWVNADEYLAIQLEKEIEMRSVFISELEAFIY